MHRVADVTAAAPKGHHPFQYKVPCLTAHQRHYLVSSAARMFRPDHHACVPSPPLPSNVLLPNHQLNFGARDEQHLAYYLCNDHPSVKCHEKPLRLYRSLRHPPLPLLPLRADRDLTSPQTQVVQNFAPSPR